MDGQPRTLVKICGVRTPEQALVAADAGADLIGLVFFPPSPRHVTVEAAAEIVRALRAAGPDLLAVGLFVNENPARINAVAAEVGLDLVQLSGDEQPADLARIDAPLLRTLRVSSRESIVRVRERITGDTIVAQRPGRLVGPLGQALTPLIDAHVPGLYGGAGVRADWAMAATLSRLWPVFLAGGLAAENVADAIGAVRPFGVDVSSGVETDGVKDPEKIRAFVRAARASDEWRTTNDE